MKILNLTESVIILPVGALQVRIEPKSISNSIVATPSVIKSAIIPLINLYLDNFRVIPNSSDLTVLDQDGCGLPADNVVGEEEAIELLAKVTSNKPETENTSNTQGKEEIRNDLGAGIPEKHNETNPKDVKVPEVKVIKGKK